MSDVSEEIVRRYYERQGYFVRTNIRYQTEGGQWADVDLCILHPNGDAATVEVKGWGQREVAMADFNEQFGVFNFVGPQALQAAGNALGRDNFRKVVVLPRVAERHREQVMNLVNEHGVQILEWPTVLRFLIQEVPINPAATNESENVIRMLKAHRDGEIFGLNLPVGQ
jgi:hypothetical protein